IPHYIHVAGTSGKGSVCLMLDAIWRAAGKKVGTLTSPGIEGLLDRTMVNGKQISKKEFAELTAKLAQALEVYMNRSRFDVPSPFEVLTALALLYFARHKVEWAIIEVGLGGRYDSTNIIPYKDVAVITNIGLDHTEILGNTKEKIAYEKAGIVKKNNLVFTQERNQKVLAVIQRECRKQKVLLHNVSGSTYQVAGGDLTGTDFIFQNKSYHLPVLGAHQIQNAVLCIEIARSVGIKDAVIQKGLNKLVLPIRMEIISKKPLIILDGAHNEDKMSSSISTIQTLKNNNRTIEQLNNTHLVVGFAADKDITAMVKQLAELKPKTIACTRFVSNIFRRTADPRELAEQFRKLLPRTKTKLFLNPHEALRWSQAQAGKQDCVLVTGSIFLSGDLRTDFRKI
ncbi:MAG TPA: Mur ligase family protein, partial [Patescibacteria group bacterium]|nr:Mur ligase family protein [Patescibacteria group bacterium]